MCLLNHFSVVVMSPNRRHHKNIDIAHILHFNAVDRARMHLMAGDWSKSGRTVCVLRSTTDDHNCVGDTLRLPSELTSESGPFVFDCVFHIIELLTTSGPCELSRCKSQSKIINIQGQLGGWAVVNSPPPYSGGRLENVKDFMF